MKAKLFVAVLVVFTTLASAQAPAPKPAPTDAEILKLIEVTGVRTQMELVMSQMKSQFNDMIMSSFRRDVPDATPELIADIRGLLDEIWSVLKTDDMVAEIVPIYRKHFNAQEVEALVTFYSSPTGRAIIAKQPLIAQESMQAGSALAQKRLSAMESSFTARIQALIAKHKPEETKAGTNTPAPKKD